MNTIVLMSTDAHYDSRKVCEFLQGEVFDSLDGFKTRLTEEGVNDVDVKLESDEIQAYSLNEFQDLANDQVLDVLTNDFIFFCQTNY